MTESPKSSGNVPLWATINLLILFSIPCAVCWFIVNVLSFPWYCTVPAMLVFCGLELLLVIGIMAQTDKEKP